MKGIIEGVNQKENKYGIIIKEVWYNGNGKCDFNKGDEVELAFEVNGNFNNITNIKLAEAGHEHNYQFIKLIEKNAMFICECGTTKLVEIKNGMGL